MKNMSLYLLVLIFTVAMGQAAEVMQRPGSVLHKRFGLIKSQEAGDRVFLTKGDDNGEPIEVIPLRHTEDRIIGGQLAANGSRPWQALVLTQDGICGGTVIAPQYVLTAAHCLPSNSSANITIMLGSNKWCTYIDGHYNVDYGFGSTLRKVSAVYTNGYNYSGHQNDIAIIMLDSPVPLNGTIKAAQLPSSLPQAEETLEVSGWGTTSEGGNFSCNLMTVSVPVVNCTMCKSIYGSSIGDYNFCAGPLEGGMGFCKGDDGGPLVKLGCNGAIVYGVVSFSNGCARPNFPGVYAKVFHYVSWIKSIIEQPINTTTTTTTTTLGPCLSPVKHYIADKFCDDLNNNPECNWDGGACCRRSIFNWNSYCSECACKN